VAKVVRTQILHLSGGEPLLHPALNRCLDAAKASGVAEKIGVVTNGWLLPKAPTGFWRRIDRLTISFFPSLPLPDDILALAYAQCERSNVLLSVKPFAEFQSFEVKAPWDDAGIVDPVV
jgi:organic radical activating enzyme